MVVLLGRDVFASYLEIFETLCASLVPCRKLTSLDLSFCPLAEERSRMKQIFRQQIFYQRYWSRNSYSINNLASGNIWKLLHCCVCPPLFYFPNFFLSPRLISLASVSVIQCHPRAVFPENRRVLEHKCRSILLGCLQWPFTGALSKSCHNW